MAQAEDTFFESQCMFLCDQVTLEILDINQAGVEKLGIARSQIISKTLNDFVQPVHPDLERAIQNKEFSSSQDKVWQLKCAGNEEGLVQFSVQIITYKGKPTKLILVHDLSEYLTKPEKEANILSSPVGFQSFPLAEIEWDAKGRVIRWSRKAERLFGYTQEEVINNEHIFETLLHPEDIDRVHLTIEQAIQLKKKTVSVTNRNITSSGNIIHCEWHNSILYDREGNVTSTYSLISDITDRIEAYKRSEKSMRSYRDLFDSISDAIYLLDENGDIVVANQGLKVTYGYNPEEVVRKNQMMLRAPGKFDNRQIANILSGKQQTPVKLEGWSKKANGEVFPTEMVIDKSNYFGRDVFTVIERDISDRKLTEQELVRRRELLGELFHTTPLGITLLNRHNEIESVNPGFERIFGYKQEEIIGLEIDRLIVPEQYYSEACELSNSTKVAEREFIRKTKDGDLINVLVYFVPIWIDGKVEAKYAIYLDITERKQTEEYIKKALREKEVLLAEIHHRVKNNLAVITGLLELQSYATNDVNSQQVLNESRMRVHSIALVHEKLYKNENLSDIEIQPYIQELVHSLERALNTSKTTIHFNLNIEDINLMITQAIPCGLLINEVVTNCFKHAFKNRETGTIWIDFKSEGKNLVLSIKDDGIGIDTINQSKLSPSLGMKLIRTLSKQLRAQTEIHVNKGTAYSFKFKKEQPGIQKQEFALARKTGEKRN